jgi:ATP-dependent Zn protease
MLRTNDRCYPGSIVPAPARPKQETFVVDKWVELAVSWLPFLVLIGLWFWFSRRSGMQARGASGVTMIELYEQQVAETRRMNGFLERIALSLEKHEAPGGS